MIHGEIPSKKIDSKSLRAKDHVIDTSDRAKKLVDGWLDKYDLRSLIRANGSVMNSLVSRISLALESAYKEGQQSVWTEVHEEPWDDPEPLI